MSFLKKKEQVIDFQLTPHGKRMLMNGKFTPVYYSFSDALTSYDGAILEHQNDIQARISEELILEISNIDGIETNIKNSESITTKQRSFIHNTALGNSSIGVPYAPAWKIKYYNGDISGSINYISGAHESLNIPQLSSSINFETIIRKAVSGSKNQSIDPTGKIYSDGTYVKVLQDFLLIQTEERNVDFLNENFDIEVYKVSSGSAGEKFIPLSFLSNNEFENITDNNVEYYLDILVDNEIPRDILCSVISELKNNDLLNDFDNLLEDCKKLQRRKIQRDIYNKDPEEIEEC